MCGSHAFMCQLLGLLDSLKGVTTTCIKPIITESLPPPIGVSIFLDVDDLKDISMLEAYIDQAAVVMFFVSKVLRLTSLYS